jgi:hypothetical protein
MGLVDETKEIFALNLGCVHVECLKTDYSKTNLSFLYLVWTESRNGSFLFNNHGKSIQSNIKT